MTEREIMVPDGCVLTVSGPHRSAAPDDRWQAWVTVLDRGEGRLAGFAGGPTLHEAAGEALARIGICA